METHTYIVRVQVLIAFHFIRHQITNGQSFVHNWMKDCDLRIANRMPAPFLLPWANTMMPWNQFEKQAANTHCEKKVLFKVAQVQLLRLYVYNNIYSYTYSDRKQICRYHWGWNSFACTSIRFRFTQSFRGVAKLRNKLYLCAVLKHVVTKFGCPRSYSLWDIGFHTDKQIRICQKCLLLLAIIIPYFPYTNNSMK